jgi:hypothetical protein
MVKLLKGDGLVDGLSVKNGEVTANLLPLVSRGLVAAQGIGLFDNVNVPVLTADGAPTDQIAQLEKAFGRDLPADFGQLVVYRSDRLAAASASLSTAQRAVTLFERAVIAIVVLTLLLGAAAIWMARGRRRAIIALALGSGAALLLARALIRRVVEDVPAIIVNPGARAATVTTLSGLAGGLIQLTTLLIVGTVIVAVGMFLQGDSSVAGRIRHSLSAGTDSVGGIMSEHRSGVAIAFFGLAVGVIAVAGISLVTMIVALVLAGAGAWFLRARPQPVADPV